MTDLVRTGAVGAALADMTPLLRRVVSLDPRALARVRMAGNRITLFVRLPFGVLAARTVPAETGDVLDRTVAAQDLLGWLDGERTDPPEPRDARWRGAAPPSTGWQRLETVPDDVIRGLVRSGALALKDAAAREGVPGAEPRAEVADALLDSVVLTARDDAGRRADVTLRTLSALTRMGFLSRDSSAAIDVAGRWLRVAGEWGSVFAETEAGGLSVLR
jgi:hypothetical protein